MQNRKNQRDGERRSDEKNQAGARPSVTAWA
jgi:hypothetical protein